AAQWENPAVDLTAYGLALAIRASSASKSENDYLTASAVRVLEFASISIRDQLASEIVTTYPWQKHSAADLLMDIADLLPEDAWTPLAKWTVRYAHEMRERRTAGWR